VIEEKRDEEHGAIDGHGRPYENQDGGQPAVERHLSEGDEMERARNHPPHHSHPGAEK